MQDDAVEIQINQNAVYKEQWEFLKRPFLNY